MANVKVRFTFRPDVIKDQLIWSLGREFELNTNIRRANVVEDQGWVVLELDGDKQEIDRGIAWIKERGVRVDAVEGDVIEG